MGLATCIDCGKEVSTSAASCPHCGRPFSDNGTEPIPKTDLAWALIGTPLAGALLLWVWVGGSPMFLAERDMGIIIGAVVIITAALAAIEVSNTANRSEYESGPAAWFISILLIWIIALPLYLHRRQRNGLKSHGLAGAFAAVIFTAIAFALAYAINQQQTDIQAAIKNITNPFVSTQPQTEAAQEQTASIAPPEVIQKRISRRCKASSEGSYAMQKLCIDTETGAWRRLNVEGEFGDLDPQIKKTCTSEPYETFALVEICIQQELAAKGSMEGTPQ